ncbi:MAG: lipopolysaccharide heptosyltransferase I [Caulobacterales bacterium]
MPSVLLVKTSSMGDVIHCLPTVTDMRRAVADLTVDWLVEENLAELPRLHPGVDRVIAVAMRRWRKSPVAAATLGEAIRFRRELRARRYDWVVDAQGLVRSAVLCRLADGPSCGFDLRSIREPLASLLYDRVYAVSFQLHAIEHSRRLAALALGYELSGPADYGLSAPGPPPAWAPRSPFLVALHATSRASKQWDEANWIELARRAAGQGLASVLPWGDEPERARAERIAAAAADCIVPPRVGLTDAAALLAAARVVVGLDTGLTHLATAVGAPTVALFTASPTMRNGTYSRGFHVDLGGEGQAPDIEAVWAATEMALAAPR